WRLHEARAVFVDYDPSSLEPFGDAADAADIAAPDACRQAVVAVVREPDRFLLVGEGDHHDDGTEDFLARETVVVAHPRVDGRLDVPTLAVVIALEHVTADGAGKPLPLGQREVLLDLLVLRQRRDRPGRR